MPRQLLYTTHISVFKLSEVFAHGSGVGGDDVWNSEMSVNSGNGSNHQLALVCGSAVVRGPGSPLCRSSGLQCPRGTRWYAVVGGGTRPSCRWPSQTSTMTNWSTETEDFWWSLAARSEDKIICAFRMRSKTDIYRPETEVDTADETWHACARKLKLTIRIWCLSRSINQLKQGTSV